MNAIPAVLSIAGVDPSGGAGVLADVKTFSALGGYGMAVITALTAQNTQGVTGVQPVSPDFIHEQLETLLLDVVPDAVKVGMLANTDVVAIVARFLRRLRAREAREIPVILDPVMVATSGDGLLDDDAVASVRELLPRASLITPNLPEAAVLLDCDTASTLDDMRDQAQRLLQLGARRVLVKAGHLGEEARAIDVYADADGLREFAADRIPTRNTHGTGCTLSSALAAIRPQVNDWPTAVERAKAYLTGAIAHADELQIGHGHGPVHHFYELWDKK